MKDWLKGLPKPPSEAQLRGILLPLLDGLEHVHDAGLLHRDIKPDNIFITTKGKPVLLDFGSARTDLGKTQTMTSLVSAGYSPMEQYQTQTRQGPATDLYALAASMIRAITGQVPATAIDRISDPGLQPPVAVSHKGKYSAEFLRGIDTAFAVPVLERPQSVKTWRQMLEGGESMPAASRGGKVRPMRPPRISAARRASPEAGSESPRGPGRWVMPCLAVLLTLGTGLVAYLWLAQAPSGSQAGDEGAAKGPASVAVKNAPSPANPTPSEKNLPLSEPPQYSPEPVSPKSGDTWEVILPGGVPMTFCYCPSGTFTMGSPKAEPRRQDDEGPVRVTLSHGYWMARTEVTQQQWQVVMRTTLEEQEKKAEKHEADGIHGKGGQHPMYYVSWTEAEAFVAKLNMSGGMPEGWRWALPTEAQWEHACRAGTTTAYSFGDTLMLNLANVEGRTLYYDSALKSWKLKNGPGLPSTSEVGSYPPNPWGLNDMHGNLQEWCADIYDDLSGGTDPTGAPRGSNRVIRDGSWDHDGDVCRSAARSSSLADSRDYGTGFRPALVFIGPSAGR